MRYRIVAALLASSALAAPSPALAEESVGLIVHYGGVPTGSGGVASLTCVAAVERLASIADIPVFTSVTCTVGDRTVQTTAPGAVAAASVQNTVIAPFELCASAWAAFIDPSANRAYVVHDSLCTTRNNV